MTVLDVDQWTSTGNIRTIPWADLIAQGIHAVSGGDSEAARRIFGGHFRVREVRPGEGPSLGHVWLTRGDDGLPHLYATNYDSSD